MKTTLLALALLASPSIAAADKDAPTTVDVEVAAATFTLSLGPRGCASAETSDASAHHEIKVCRSDGDYLEFEVERTEIVKDTRTRQHVRVTAKLAAAKRTVIAELGATEVAATLR